MRDLAPQGARTDINRLLALMFAAFADTLGVFLILALLPYYAQEFGASAFEVGAVVAAFAASQTASAPVWGRVSDRWGRRPVILLGLLISLAGHLLFAFAPSLAWLFISRLVQGVGGGTVSVVFAYVADAIPAAQRAERIGWVTAATSAAAMVGPAIGSFAVRFDPTYPGLAAALLCAASIVLAALWLPEPVGARRVSKPRHSLVRALVEVARHPGRIAHTLIWIYALSMIATSSLTAVIGLFLDHRFAVGEEDIWVFFAYLAGLSLLVRMVVLGPLIRRLGEVPVLRLGALLLAAGLLGIPLTGRALDLWWTVLLIAFGTSFLYPCTTALVSRYPRGEQAVGEILGLQQAFGGLARIAGPLLAGAAFGGIGPSAPMVAAGLVMVGVGTWSVLGLSNRIAQG